MAPRQLLLPTLRLRYSAAQLPGADEIILVPGAACRGPRGTNAAMTDAIGTVEAVVRSALQVVCPEVGAIHGDVNLASELGIDSVQVMDLIMEIEDRLDISIPIATIAEARTFDQLCAGIRRLAEPT